MSCNSPPALPPVRSARGIVCPCGGRLFVHATRRPCVGVVVRHRRCERCGTRAVTHERLKRLVPPAAPPPA